MRFLILNRSIAKTERSLNNAKASKLFTHSHFINSGTKKISNNVSDSSFPEKKTEHMDDFISLRAQTTAGSYSSLQSPILGLVALSHHLPGIHPITFLKSFRVSNLSRRPARLLPLPGRSRRGSSIYGLWSIIQSMAITIDWATVESVCRPFVIVD